MVKNWSLLALLCGAMAISACATRTATALVIASDDFNAEGGGVGFAAADEWGNLLTGASNTEQGNPAFRAFEPALDPLAASSGSVYIAFDFSSSQAVNWGGLALFEGVDGGAETFFAGQPNGLQNYGVDLKAGQGYLDSGVPIVGGEVHKMIVQIEFGAADDTYRLWVDNFNESSPNGEVALDGFVVAGAWQSARVASDVGSQTFVAVDNLVIADSPADVGLTAAVNATVTVNRATGQINLAGASSVSNVVGYSLRSNSGGFDPGGWVTIDGRDATDAVPAGDGSVDNDDWDVVSVAGSTTHLSEATTDATPGDGLTLTSTPLGLGAAWKAVPTRLEDLFATITVDSGGTATPLAVNVSYVGGEIAEGDLDGDGDIDTDDWTAFKTGQGVVNNGMTPIEAYRMGDMDGNLTHDLEDFDLFADAFDLANGAGAFAAAIAGVPEPSACAMLAACVTACGLSRRRGLLAGVGAMLLMFGLSGRAEAVIYASDDFSADNSGVGWAGGDAWETRDAGGFLTTYPNGSANNTFSSRNFSTPIDPQNALTYIRFDYRQAQGTGNDWGGFAFFEGINATGQESFFAGPNPGGTNNYAFEEKAGPSLVDSGIPYDLQFHTIIGAIDQTGADTVYSIWVDNFLVGSPDATVTVPGQGSIDAPWQSLRFSGAGNEEIADNLLITDAAEESLIFAQPTADTLGLVVNKSTGEVLIENVTGTDVGISAYTISSATGVLFTGDLAGDYNADGAVNAADYTIYRDNDGGDAAVLSGNGSGAATVTVADYDLWHTNYGRTAGADEGWESLAERDTAVADFPQGSGDGAGWEEGANPSRFEVEEYRLIGESTMTASPISLGKAYGGGPGGSQNLFFQYRSNGELVVGDVRYVAGAAQLSSATAAPEPVALGLTLLLGASALFARRRD
ncbi:hypothetical protein Pla123a_24180 [Posidoniimonas polymericola]|uniref:PEP-CTERM protein-sorting domain-containing protein n=1 Tax=Posidoniimonas polymericola TaxID=2528002 RepID=A0A5C5YQ45_9BACT|nr:hypothetical protein [Posidoniimonas polymericola]TWT76993.1 hypothetical protein Pla123a_24180 [Posidoniimonas polymericola]